MKAALRFALATAVFACGLAAPAVAQEVNASSAAPAAGEVIGPPQLRDFSLNGTVTRQSEPQPERSEPAAAARPRSSSATAQSPQPPESARSEPARAAQTDRQVASATESSAGPGRAVPAEAASARPLAEQVFTPAPVAGFAVPSTGGGEPVPFSEPPSEDSWAVPMLPWAVALLLFGGGALLYLRRQRSRYAFAGAPEMSELVASDPAPRPVPPAPAPAPAPQPAPLAGVVTTRLRPWLELEFRPERAVIDGEQAVIQFEVAVFNSGSAPARDVLIEAAMFNAGPQQDQAIGAFFGRPLAQGDPVPVIPPLKRLAFRSAVRMPREQLQQFELGGRRLFAPIIGVNANYRWSGGSAQTATSFLVGREGRGDKLAPLQAGSASREISGLAARELEQRIRR